MNLTRAVTLKVCGLIQPVLAIMLSFGAYVVKEKFQLVQNGSVWNNLDPNVKD